MKKLSEFMVGRENNLNLIRIIAALSVLVSHSFAIVTGERGAEPLQLLLDVTPGTMAVDIFFVTSGLLLANSLINKGNALEFIASRIVRIYPALVLAVFLTAFVLGPIFTELPIFEYFYNSDVYAYFIKTSTLVRGVGYTLPGVFNGNPLYSQVNGSLWTLPLEIKMYVLLFCVWYFWQKIFPLKSHIFLKVSFLFVSVFAGGFYFYEYIGVDAGKATHGISRFIFLFFAGSTLALYQEKIPFSSKILGFFLVLVTVSSLNKTTFFFGWNIFLPYLVVLLAYQPSRILSYYNKVGDYSYGFYIYAFPVQQMVVSIVNDVSIAGMIFYSTIFTGILAVFSWHLLEKPMMRMKGNIFMRNKFAAVA